MPEQEGIPILNKDYDLRGISDIELANTMEKQCEIYDMVHHEISTAILDVWWEAVERIAEEIVRRKGR